MPGPQPPVEEQAVVQECSIGWHLFNWYRPPKYPPGMDPVWQTLNETRRYVVVTDPPSSLRPHSDGRTVMAIHGWPKVRDNGDDPVRLPPNQKACVLKDWNMEDLVMVDVGKVT